MIRFVFFSLLCSLVSCNENIKSSGFYNDFKDNRWGFNQKVEFDFTIEKNDQLWLHFGHIYNYDYDLIPIEIELTKPETSLDKIVLTEDLKIKNKDGKDAGECLGDICDYYQKVKIERLEAGKYHLVLRNKSDLPYLPNVLGIGYQIRKNKE